MAKKEEQKVQMKVQKKVAYYDDDYVEELMIEETATLPRVKLKYKPLNMIQTSKLTDDVMEGKTILAATEATLKMISKQLVEWDIRKSNGEIVDFKDVASLRKIDPTIINKIVGRIRGDQKGPFQDVEALRNELKN